MQQHNNRTNNAYALDYALHRPTTYINRVKCFIRFRKSYSKLFHTRIKISVVNGRVYYLWYGVML